MLFCNECFDKLMEYNPNIDIDDIERLSDAMPEFEQVNRGRKPKPSLYPAATATV